jgi:allophanate hydrolase
MSTFIHRVEPPPGNGPLLAVKDNIDVAGLPTTAGCPEFAFTPSRDAACVGRLRAWGARIVDITAWGSWPAWLGRTPASSPRP